jgi:hypothetical protein
MKKKLITASLLTLSCLTQAQEFNPPGSLPSTNSFRDGRTGFGMFVPPAAHMVEIETNMPNDGLSITQLGPGDCLIKLNNNGPGGTQWSISSNNSGSIPPGQYFAINNLPSASTPFIIDATTDNIGIGTTSPTNARLEVISTNQPTGKFDRNSTIFNGSPGFALGGYAVSSVTTAAIGVDASGISTGGNGYGVQAYASGMSNIGVAFGVYSSGKNAQTNYGGYFDAFNTTNPFGGNYGVFAVSGGGSTNDWAGYFQGNVNINGAAYCTISAWSSDQKLKKNIKPFTSGLEKISLLKPSTYNFKTEEEFKYMNLPKGQQLGLIAQELEKVFPDLVTELPENIQKDAKGNITANIPAHKVVNYIGLIPVLISAVQEQQAQIARQNELINSLLKKEQSTTGIDVNALNEDFALSQNEPNPFNGETTIKYKLPANTNKAVISIYDLSGKQIVSFPIEKDSSSTVITSEKLAAGIYIYSILADGKVLDSKRMIVAEK